MQKKVAKCKTQVQRHSQESKADRRIPYLARAENVKFKQKRIF